MNKVNIGDLADNLITLRGAAGLSQRELAHRAGIAATQLSRYETGRSRPRPVVLDSLAKALDVPVAALYGEVDAHSEAVANVAMGMSLRDAFVMAAMQGILANPGGPIQANDRCGWGLVNCTYAQVADEAYAMADAMLAARGAQ
ncbi:helix-turn-helix domain-containing protein [Achromobacter xylosoxidans]